jgi:hypothetical protein
MMRRLVDRTVGGGTYGASWDGRDDTGKSVASGVYFYRMEAEAFVERRKMVLLK